MKELDMSHEQETESWYFFMLWLFIVLDVVTFINGFFFNKNNIYIENTLTISYKINMILLDYIFITHFPF